MYDYVNFARSETMTEQSFQTNFEATDPKPFEYNYRPHLDMHGYRSDIWMS